MNNDKGADKRCICANVNTRKYCITNAANEYAVIGSTREHFIRALIFELIHVVYSMYGFMKMEKNYQRLDCSETGRRHKVHIEVDFIIDPYRTIEYVLKGSCNSIRIRIGNQNYF